LIETTKLKKKIPRYRIAGLAAFAPIFRTLGKTIVIN